MKTITAKVMANGFATGATKSAKASSGVPAVSFTGIGGRSGAACSCRSLIAWAAFPTVLDCFGWRSAPIFSTMFARYSGRLAASDTAWLAASAPTAKMIEKPTATTMSVEAARPSFQRSSHRTAGASRKESRSAIARGINTSLARYRTAAATSSAMTEERRGRLALEMYADTAAP